jgi:hypothetical protein
MKKVWIWSRDEDNDVLVYTFTPQGPAGIVFGHSVQRTLSDRQMKRLEYLRTSKLPHEIKLNGRIYEF